MARLFNGSSDYIAKAATVANLPTGATPRTILAWIMPTDYNTHFIIASWGEAANYKMSAFSVEITSGHLLVAFYANDNISTADVATGAWSFVGFTHDGSTTSKLYLNGALVSTKADHAAINTTASAFDSGQHPFGGATSWAKGRIAMVMGWKVALTLNEIIGAQYGIIPQPANMFLYWPLWGVASPEPDLSGNLNNGTVTGAALANHPPVGCYAPPRVHLFPSPIYAIDGVTRDSTGAAIGGCTVQRFRTSDKAFIDETTSDGSGNYRFSPLDPSIAYFIRALKDGSPNVFGITDDDLVGA